MPKIWVRSMFGANTKEPIVSLAIGDGQMVHMSPEEARALALNLLRGAEGALSDAFLWSFFREYAGADEKEAAKVIMQFREWREKRKEVKGDRDKGN